MPNSNPVFVIPNLFRDNKRRFVILNQVQDDENMGRRG
jgi:hypothetical protein